MQLAEYFLQAKIAEGKGEMNDATKAYEMAIQEQDTLSYDEPPNWLFSIRDNLGTLLLKEKRYKEAEEVFRTDLKQHPRNGRSLFGRKKSLDGQGRVADAYFVNQAFQQAWRFSDIDLNLDNL